MANSNKEYTAQADISYNTSFITPDYLEGRGDTDIKVYVDAVLQPTSNYNLNGTYLNFLVGNVPTEGQKIRIVRTTSQDARLTDYTDGSLLNAETLDKDSDQTFYMAQEALDEANRTIVGASQFYYSQEAPPQNPAKGTLWYHLNETANELRIWDGVEWHFAAPALSTTTFTKTDSQFSATFAGDASLVASEVFNVPEMNRNTVVYLNGIRLRGKDEPEFADFQKYNNAELDWLSGNEVQPDLENLFIRGSLSNTDVVTVVTPTGGYATRILEAEANVVAAEATVPVSAGVASKYAVHPEDVSFTVDDVVQYSALHYAAKAEESATAAANTVSGFSTTVSNQESTSITALTDQQALSITAITDQQALSETAVTDQQALSVQAVQNVANAVDSVTDINAAVAAGETAIQNAETASVGAVQAASTTVNQTVIKYADNPVDTPFLDNNGASVYSAKHHASVAESLSNLSVDKLSGWTVIDSETIVTNGADEPKIVSDTTFDLNAPDGVKSNGVPLPMGGGNISLVNKVFIGSSNLTLTSVDNVHTLTFTTPFASADDYQVMASYNGNYKAITKVVKSNNSFSVQACDVNTAYSDLAYGDIVITVYKFA